MNEQTLRFSFLDARCRQPGFGFFHYLNSLFVGAQCGVPRPLQRISSIARMHGCNLILEEDIDFRDITPLVDAKQWDPNTDPLTYCKCTRLTYFRVSDSRAQLGKHIAWEGLTFTRRAAFQRRDSDLQCFLEATSAGTVRCIAQVDLYIQRRTAGAKHAYVHSAIVTDGLSPHHYVHSRAPFFISCLTGIVPITPFTVDGSFFAQQNGYTSCCAHAAIITSITNIYAARGLRCPITYMDINNHLNLDNQNRHVSDGLTAAEITDAFAMAGIKAHPLTTDGFSGAPEDIITSSYYNIESGLPAILGFFGKDTGHALAVVGHTFDESLWPGATHSPYYSMNHPYSPSHLWVDKLIVQDDNFGPYSTLPRKELEKQKPLIILPSFPWADLDIPAFAEHTVYRFLKSELPYDDNFDTLERHIESVSNIPPLPNEHDWLKELFDCFHQDKLVMRTVPISLREYLEFLFLNEALVDPAHKPEIIRWAQGLTRPGPFWMVEISVPELFERNHRRLGEALVLGPVADEDERCVVLVRLPRILVTTGHGSINILNNSSGCRHYPLHRNELEHFRQLLSDM